jgi:ribosomal protein S27E
MGREEYRQKRLRDLDELRAADHDPELVSASGILGQSFGRRFDYVSCTRCARRDVRWFPKRSVRCPQSSDVLARPTRAAGRHVLMRTTQTCGYMKPQGLTM